MSNATGRPPESPPDPAGDLYEWFGQFRPAVHLYRVLGFFFMWWFVVSLAVVEAGRPAFALAMLLLPPALFAGFYWGAKRLTKHPLVIGRK